MNKFIYMVVVEIVVVQVVYGLSTSWTSENKRTVGARDTKDKRSFQPCLVKCLEDGEYGGLCQNGGSCFFLSDAQTHACECKGPYLGERCEVYFPTKKRRISNAADATMCKECSATHNTCKNGGKCYYITEDSQTHCECKTGYTGRKCEKVDPK
ncbi:neurogenic locus notch homolog protein 1-like [Convolutriloba macropyga]|uniref:neurogenic locus notch homolog protein 1-like n=1 Tax=Convolutriloba macropyga TaxID=536237 RepID=UPI003F5284FC